ncbi:hypothetical protein BH10PSE2_BH10PSE2_06940 [soil metagenome]
MTDPDDQPDDASRGLDPDGETPIQKALRLKQAGIDARPKPPRGGRFQREQAARIATGSSKPWMKK